VVTASYDKTARIWDAATITKQDTPADVLLLADLAEATGGLTLQAYAQRRLAPGFVLAGQGAQRPARVRPLLA
jgi:hypothetical protein